MSRAGCVAYADLVEAAYNERVLLLDMLQSFSEFSLSIESAQLRGREALETVEDYARFELVDQFEEEASSASSSIVPRGRASRGPKARGEAVKMDTMGFSLSKTSFEDIPSVSNYPSLNSHPSLNGSVRRSRAGPKSKSSPSPTRPNSTLHQLSQTGFGDIDAKLALDMIAVREKDHLSKDECLARLVLAEALARLLWVDVETREFQQKATKCVVEMEEWLRVEECGPSPFDTAMRLTETAHALLGSHVTEWGDESGLLHGSDLPSKASLLVESLKQATHELCVLVSQGELSRASNDAPAFALRRPSVVGVHSETTSPAPSLHASPVNNRAFSLNLKRLSVSPPPPSTEHTQSPDREASVVPVHVVRSELPAFVAWYLGWRNDVVSQLLTEAYLARMRQLLASHAGVVDEMRQRARMLEEEEAHHQQEEIQEAARRRLDRMERDRAASSQQADECLAVCSDEVSRRQDIHREEYASRNAVASLMRESEDAMRTLQRAMDDVGRLVRYLGEEPQYRETVGQEEQFEWVTLARAAYRGYVEAKTCEQIRIAGEELLATCVLDESSSRAQIIQQHRSSSNELVRTYATVLEARFVEAVWQCGGECATILNSAFNELGKLFEEDQRLRGEAVRRRQEMLAVLLSISEEESYFRSIIEASADSRRRLAWCEGTELHMRLVGVYRRERGDRLVFEDDFWASGLYAVERTEKRIRACVVAEWSIFVEHTVATVMHLHTQQLAFRNAATKHAGIAHLSPIPVNPTHTDSGISTPSSGGYLSTGSIPHYPYTPSPARNSHRSSATPGGGRRQFVLPAALQEQYALRCFGGTDREPDNDGLERWIPRKGKPPRKDHRPHIQFSYTA